MAKVDYSEQCKTEGVPCDGGTDCYQRNMQYLGKKACKKCLCSKCTKGKCPPSQSLGVFKNGKT